MSREARASTHSAAALGLLILVSGCGGAPTTLSAAQLLRSADAICTQANRQVATADARIPALSGTDAARLTFIRSAQVTLPLSQHGLDRLRGLRAPAALSSDWRRFLTDVHTETDGERALIAAAQANDLARGQRVQLSMQAGASDLRIVVGRLGLTVCGRAATA